MRSTDVDLNKLATEVRKRLIDDDPDSWWAVILSTAPETLSGHIDDGKSLETAFRTIINRYDGAPDSGPMPSGHMVSLACWIVTGLSPVDFLWFLKTYPWLFACTRDVLDVRDLTEREYEEHVQKTLEAVGVETPKLGKVICTFKTPDVARFVSVSVLRHVVAGRPGEEKIAILEILRKWIEHDEILRVEFDLDAKTATVLHVK